MSEVVSPCTKLCTLDQQRVCIGCGRSVDEIAAWLRVDDARRREICRMAEARLAARKRRDGSVG